MAESDTEPVFFELSWSILSTIGAANVFFGLLVGSVTDFTLITFVPIVTSIACAFANGLCFYGFYLTSPPAVNRAVASGFADIAWLVGTSSNPNCRRKGEGTDLEKLATRSKKQGCLCTATSSSDGYCRGCRG